MIAFAVRRVQRNEWKNVDIQLMDITQEYYPEKFDLLVTRTVLMHIAPEDIRATAFNISQMSDNLIIFEYFEPYGVKPLAKHNWLHDYVKIFQELKYTVKDTYERPDMPQMLFNFVRN